MSEEIKPHHLRALASDIEDCHNPQSWADYCRAAAAMLETQAARIAELEELMNKIRDITEFGNPITCVAEMWGIAHAALEGGKNDPAT